MNTGCSPNGIVDICHPRQGIADIRNSGFADVLLDMTLSCRPDEPDKWNLTMLSNEMTQFANQCKQMNLYNLIAYAPYLDKNKDYANRQEKLIELVEESFRIAGKAGCKYIVIKPLLSIAPMYSDWKINYEYYIHFVPFAKQYGIQILLENQCENVNGHLVRGICSDAYEASKWIDDLNKEAGVEIFAFCLNTGTSNLCGQNVYDTIKVMESKLKAVILCDNDGNTENSMLPFTSICNRISGTDWLNLIRGLREILFEGELILNFSDTASSFSPILRPALLQFAKSIVDYFQWQIEIEKLLGRYTSIVLFGAGNMCRNYMKCYGEKHPPLFTCDNDSSRWGTTFFGLEVKSPDSLKTLPENCAIFICNIYYREVEKQLKEMGIMNPVEFFNDEYLPSYYYDRLKNGRNQDA